MPLIVRREGGETMVSNERAQALIGYEPAYHIAGN